MDLIVRVAEVRGRCPVYQEGASFRLLDGYRLLAEAPVCMHALASLMPYYNALRFASPEELGLAGKGDRDTLSIQCLDPCVQTGGGTVIFAVTRSPSRAEG